MGSDNTAISQWGSLLDSAMRIKQLAPWEWMSETDIFGVKNPESDEFGFVSIMGEAGEHFGVALYRGYRALYDFFNLQFDEEQKQYEYPELLLEIPQIQASYEDRADLEPWDYQLIRKLNLKFRGKKAWPRFQSFRPGYLPWKLDGSEVHFLRYALDQCYEVALRVQRDPQLLEFEDDFLFFIRMPLRQRDGHLDWQDNVARIQVPEPLPVPIAWNPADMKRLKRLPKSGHAFEVDFFMFPAAIGKNDERPKCTYILLMVHVRSGMVFAAEALAIESSLEKMWGQIPAKFLAHLANNEMRPKEIRVRSDFLFHMLQPVKKELGFKLVRQNVLKKLDHAKEEMLAFFENGPPSFD